MTKLITAYFLIIAVILSGIIYNAHLIRLKHEVGKEIKQHKVVAVATLECGVLEDGDYRYCVEKERKKVEEVKENTR